MSNLTAKERSILKERMAAILSDKIDNLSVEMQTILLTDMVTAFESRLRALTRAQPNQKLEMLMGVNTIYQKA